jgi:hypothetical protein
MFRDLILQNPIASLLLVVIPLAGIIWKVLYALYVKPRDFRISTMEQDISDLRNEVLNMEKRERGARDPTSLTHERAVETEAAAESRQRANTPVAILDEVILDDLQQLLDIWNDESLTELQKTHVEETYIGTKVVWEVLVKSVSEEKDGKIWVTIVSPSAKFGLDAAHAIFDKKYKEALLLIKKDEHVIISGVIERFFLSPILQDCQLRRK